LEDFWGGPPRFNLIFLNCQKPHNFGISEVWIGVWKFKKFFKGGIKKPPFPPPEEVFPGKFLI